MYIDYCVIAKQLKVHHNVLLEVINNNKDNIDISTKYNKKGNINIQVNSSDIDKLQQMVLPLLDNNYYKLVNGRITKISGVKDEYVYLGVITTMGVPIGYKIGVSVNPENRACTLNSEWSSLGLNMKIEMLKISSKTNNAYKLELSLHRLLEHLDNKLIIDIPKGVKVSGSTEFFKFNDVVKTTAELICNVDYINTCKEYDATI